MCDCMRARESVSVQREMGKEKKSRNRDGYSGKTKAGKNIREIKQT